MNEFKIFENAEFGQVRTVTIDNEPWFVGKDVAVALGYKDTSDSLKKHVLDEDKLTRRFADSGQNRQMYIINESGLYALIFGSKLASAKRFKHWVTSEVLPAIRKTGSYQKPLSLEQMMRIQLGMVDKHEERLDRLENTMNIDYAQQKQLKNFANEIVVAALGGKGSTAYKYRDEDGSKISSQTFSRFWHDFNDYFNINAYANLPRVKFKEALEYINRWQPPTNMQLEIGRINRMSN